MAKDGRVDPPVSEAVSFWAQHNGCSNRAERLAQGSIHRERYAGCRNDTEVVLYTIERGGHAWPGAHGRTPAGGFSATAVIREFFLGLLPEKDRET